jgi:DNA-binding SARP family transcriptional activator
MKATSVRHAEPLRCRLRIVLGYHSVRDGSQFGHLSVTCRNMFTEVEQPPFQSRPKLVAGVDTAGWCGVWKQCRRSRSRPRERGTAMLTKLTESLLGNMRHGGSVLTLIDGFELIDNGRTVEVPESCKRLLAFVAVRGGRVERGRAAAALWPKTDDTRAGGNLRSALWRLHRAELHVLRSDSHVLSLRRTVLVDVHLVTEWSDRLVRGIATAGDLQVQRCNVDAFELLPGCFEDWALLERERVRQQVLHGLEVLSHRLTEVGRHAEAVEIAMTAVSVEPLRESGQRALIEAHLGEGNWEEARRHYELYRQLARRQLAVEPDDRLCALVYPGPPYLRHSGGLVRKQAAAPPRP